jgi:hypothetical protein
VFGALFSFVLVNTGLFKGAAGVFSSAAGRFFFSGFGITLPGGTS